ncbi:hypothetical protein L4C33_14770 [Vibrio makurazakiensis]|uniref:hypothetical protein n=1 Tax=Vibrio TaxID=662 RepID=UPI00142EED13|nr:MULTISPECIES: hypothetical protein [Vibrio]
MTDDEFQALKDVIKPLSQARLKALLHAVKREEDKLNEFSYDGLLTEQELDLLQQVSTD